MPITYTTTAAPVEDIGVKLLVYSPPGYGKTVLTATLPGNPIIVSAESGLLSLQPANQMRVFGHSRDLPVIVVRNKADFREAYEVIASPHGKDFDSVGIDSLSEIGEVCLASELRTAKDPRAAYGEMQQFMADYIRKFRDLPGKHVYMTAKQDRITEPDGKVLFGAMMPGKTMAINVGHFFDEVFALVLLDAKDARGHNYRALRTRPDTRFQAKDRSGALDELEEPNLTKVIAKIAAQKVS